MFKLNTDLCKGCGYCVKFCAKGCLELGTERNKHGHFFPARANEDKCNSCAMCAVICPEGAIEIINGEEEK